MFQKIRVRTNKGPDLRAESVLHDIKKLLNLSSITDVKTATVYRFEGINRQQASILAEKLLCERINQIFSINQRLIEENARHVIEIAYKPGVMNPERASLVKSAKDLGIHVTSADSSREYYFFGNALPEDIQLITLRLNLFNPVIEYVKHPDDPITYIPIQIMTDMELLLLSKDKLFLNIDEMRTIQKYFIKIKRNPTDAELETLAQTWSEHSGHKTFKSTIVINGKEKKPFITRIKEEALKHNKNIVSAFVDNSGVSDFYDGYAICGKVETHNSPSAIEPYGGAMTGSGGVFRDIMGTGQGAKTIASTDMFCFAHPDINPSLLPLGTLHPEYLLKRVVMGVKDYGNRMGIPTNNGSVHFHNDFRAKPTVIVGAYGIIPKNKAQIGAPKPGDLIICVGGKTGRDGIHGATFSSGEMTDRTISVNASAVQIGNAIEEKRMFDAILEMRDRNLVRAIQDCGGGGFSSAIGEMGKEFGVSVHLENVSTKYEGLFPWETWISESQERMIIAVDKKNLKEIETICNKYNVELTTLGTFNTTKKLQVYFHEDVVCNLDMTFLHDGLPKKKMVATKPTTHSSSYLEPRQPTTQKVWIECITKVLQHDNVCSKEPIVRLYDHTVQGTNILQPYNGEQLDGPSDAAVIRPLLDKPYGMIIAHGLNPVLNNIDPYWGSIWASVEALSNYVSVGGDYTNASLINNYIWPFPDQESLWSLDKSVDAVVDCMKIFKIPVISGKDSLSSTYRGKDGSVIKIPPVLCMSIFGRIPDVRKTISSDFKQNNSVIVMVGKPNFFEMGGSIYYDTYGIVGESIPQIDLKALPKIFSTIYNAIQQNSILSCHDISEGGMFTTIFEMCVGGDMGSTIDTKRLSKQRPDYTLFNETAGCFILEVSDKVDLKKLFKSIPYTVIGRTTKQTDVSIAFGKEQLFKVSIDTLKQSWQAPMRKLFS